MGGTPNQGIMHGLVDRKGYKQGTSWEETLEKYPSIKEAYGAIGGIDQPRDTSMYEMLIGGGLNLVSGAGAGDGLMSNVAKSYKNPSEEFFKSQRARQAYESDLKTTAAQAGLQQKWKMDQIAAQKADDKSPLYNVYLKQAIEDGYDGPKAERYAAYQAGMKRDLENKVGANSISEVIIDFNVEDKEKNKKQLANLKKQVGKYVYDVFEGNIKLIQIVDGVVSYKTYNSVADIDLADLKAFSEEEKIQKSKYENIPEFGDIAYGQQMLTP